MFVFVTNDYSNNNIKMASDFTMLILVSCYTIYLFSYFTSAYQAIGCRHLYTYIKKQKLQYRFRLTKNQFFISQFLFKKN